MHLVVFVYYALTHYLLWDNDDYAGCTFSRMEKEINIFSTNILISTFLTVFYFQKYLFLGFGTYKHFMLFRYLVESFKIFCFLLQHFLFFIEQSVVCSLCVASLLCAASLRFVLFYWSIFCNARDRLLCIIALLVCFSRPNTAMAKFLSSFIDSSSFFFCINSCSKAY